MKKHHKITALERDQIAWWLAGGITIREMARQWSEQKGESRNSSHGDRSACSARSYDFVNTVEVPVMPQFDQYWAGCC
jgi:hypothetical protein